MNRNILIGLVAGLILGVVESFLFYGGSIMARPTIVIAVLGALVGFISTKIDHKSTFYVASAVAGLLFFFAIATQTGTYLDDLATGAITGFLIAFLTGIIGGISSET